MRYYNIEDITTRKYLNLYFTINGDFIVFYNGNHCINDYILLTSYCMCNLHPINTLESKWFVIPIERNIRVGFSNQFR